MSRLVKRCPKCGEKFGDSSSWKLDSYSNTLTRKCVHCGGVVQANALDHKEEKKSGGKFRRFGVALVKSTVKNTWRLAWKVGAAVALIKLYQAGYLGDVYAWLFPG